MTDDVRRLGREETFSIIPHWLLFSGVSSGALHLYAVLWKYSDAKGRSAQPSQATLAEHLDKSVASVKRYTKELIDVAAIDVISRTTELGDPDRNLYLLRTTPPEGANTRAGGPFTHEGTPSTDEPGVRSPMNGGPSTHEGRGPFTSEPRTRTNSIKNSSSPLPPSPKPGSSMHEPEEGRSVIQELLEGSDVYETLYRWCELTGQAVTDYVLDRYRPQIEAFLEAGGNPTDDFLKRAAAQNIREPKLWATVAGAVPATVFAPGNCDTCENRGMVGETDTGELVPVDDPDVSAVSPCPHCHPAALGATR